MYRQKKFPQKNHKCKLLLLATLVGGAPEENATRWKVLFTSPILKAKYVDNNNKILFTTHYQ